MRELIAMVAEGIEALAVLVIVSGIVYAIVRYFLHTRLKGNGAYKRFKDRIGNSLLLGLEFLVAADIIRTVALNPTLQSVAVLGLLVLIRTFLSWALVVEIEGTWPWKAKRVSREKKKAFIAFPSVLDTRHSVLCLLT